MRLPGRCADDRDEPKWAKKGLFVMLMLDEGLARVNTELDLDSLRLNIKQGNREVAAGRLTDETDRERLEQFFWQLLPALPSPPILVRSAGGHFMDKPDNVISLINLATVRSLEEKWGVRDRSAALSCQHLCRRCQALGRIRLGRERHQDRQCRVRGRPQERPLRRDQCQSGRAAAAISTFRVRCARRSATRISASI